MAVVGSAEIVVRAITTGVKRDIQSGFSGLSGVGQKAGRDLGNALFRGLKASGSGDDNVFGRLVANMRQLYPEAESSQKAFTRLMRAGYVLQGVLGPIAGSISAVVGSLGSLIGSAGGAVSSLAALLPIVGAFAAAMIGAKLALGGVGAAVSELTGGGGGGGGGGRLKEEENAAKRVEDAYKNLARTLESANKRLVDANKRLEKAQVNLNKAFEEAREEIQQLNFDAEDAAIGQKRAALNLERARETLLRAQDLPPNSRARREAELAYAEADLAYRRAVDRNSDLAKEQERLAETGIEGTETVIKAREDLQEAEDNLAETVIDNARDIADAEERLNEALKDQEDLLKGVGRAGGGAQSAFDKLTESQKVFAKFLAEKVVPLFKELKEEVAQGFLPKLQTAIETIIAYAFPTFKAGLGEIGVALGNASITFSEAFKDQTNLNLLKEFFTNSSTLIELFGEFAKVAFGALLGLLKATTPIAERFVNYLINTVGNFEKFVKSVKGAKQIENFFNNAGEQAARWGQITRNIFDTIKNLIYDSFKPGSGADVLLTYFERVTRAWAQQDQEALNRNLKAAAENTVSLLTALGQVFKIFLKIGTNPAVGKFWENFADSQENLLYLLDEAVKVGPAFANLLSTIVQILSAFADSGQAIAFFETLGMIADALYVALAAIKPFLDFIGPFIGTISALSFAFGLLSTAILIAIGYKMALAKGLSTIVGIFKRTTVAATETAVATAGAGVAADGASKKFMAFLKNPIVLGIAAITAALVAAVVAAQAFKEQRIERSVDALTNAFITGADASTIWSAALLSIGDDFKQYIDSTGEFKRGVSELRRELSVPPGLRWIGDVGAFFGDRNRRSAQATEEILKSVGITLGKLASTDINTAKQSFQDFATQNKLTREELVDLIDVMPEFKSALIANANEMGVNITNSEGLIDNTKLVAFAYDDATAALERQAAAAVEAAEKLEGQRQAVIDAATSNNKFADDMFNVGEVTEAAYNKGTFSLDKYLDTVEQQLQASANFQTNLLKLQAMGLSEASLNMIRRTGKDAAVIAQSIIDEGMSAVDRFNKISYTGSIENEKIWQDLQVGIENSFAANTGGEALLNKLKQDLSQAKTKTDLEEIAKRYQSYVQAGLISTRTGFNIDIGVGKDYFTPYFNGVIKGFGGIGVNPGLRVPVATGGLILGAGTGTSDSIPAMLSNGEFVIRASQTRKYLPLLQAINSGRYASSPVGFAQGGIVGGAQGSVMTGGPGIINMTINPSPGMDERELAAAISRQLALQFRKGAIA